MFEKDNEIKAYALTIWANNIETGILSLSAEDAIMRNRKNLIRPLTLDQQKFVIRLRDLANKELTKEN